MTLRSARVQRGLSIEQAARETRIAARFLEALEDEAFDELPAPVYVRGFLRSYANFLRVDAAPLLAQLEAAGPLSGPERFVGGPSQPPSRSDPFQRTTPPPVPGPPQMPEPEPFADWDPEDVPEEPVRPLSGRFYENEPTVAWEMHEPVQPRRVAGVLMEREGAADTGQQGARVLAIIGGAVLVILFVLAVAALFSRGSSGGSNAALPAVTPTATSRPGTVIAVGSATASVSASASASVTATAGTATPASTGTPTSTPGAGTATAAATPTATSQPPTATTVPVTSTPTAPPPTPTQIVAPGQTSECSRSSDGSLDCGASPYRIVCYPGGWFVDVGRDFALPDISGWRAISVSGTFGDAVKAGSSGC